MKVIVATVKVNGDWINLTLNDSKEVSVSTKDKKGNLVNQNLKSILTDPNFKQGSEVEMDLKEWNGKWFGNESKSNNKSGKAFTPADRSFDAAKTAALACATIYANKSVDELKGLTGTFETIHKMIMSKVTKPTTEEVKS